MAWNAAIRPDLALAGPADRLVADGPAAARREHRGGGGEGDPAAEQADQPGGLAGQEAVQAEEAIDDGPRPGRSPGRRSRSAADSDRPRAVITDRDDRPLLRPVAPQRAGPAGRPFFSRASARAWRVASRALRRKSRPLPSRSDSQRSMTWPVGAEPAVGLQFLGQDKGLLDDQCVAAGSWRRGWRRSWGPPGASPIRFPGSTPKRNRVPESAGAPVNRARPLQAHMFPLCTSILSMSDAALGPRARPG